MMYKAKPVIRFFLGFAISLFVVLIGLLLITAIIPTWGSQPQEVDQILPGDEIIPQPDFAWNHAITIHASPEQIYPWLVQIGDNRGGFYSFTFIENVFMIASNDPGRYVNADHIHPEWQEPPTGLGIIVNTVAIQEYQPGEYVLASATEILQDFQWTWLWFLQPVDQNTTRLIVRHRFDFPQEMPQGAIKIMVNAGYVMERGMLLGIRQRAEGRVPPSYVEPLGIFLWLVAFICGLVAAVRFIRLGGYLLLFAGLDAIIILFIFTFIQPAVWLRVVLDLALIAGLGIACMQRTPRESSDARVVKPPPN